MLEDRKAVAWPDGEIAELRAENGQRAHRDIIVVFEVDKDVPDRFCTTVED